MEKRDYRNNNNNQRRHFEKIFSFSSLSSLTLKTIMKNFAILLFQLHLIYFRFINAGDECCKAGQIYSNRNECHMIPKVNEVPSDRIPCLLQTTYCCMKHTQENYCRNVAKKFIKDPKIDQFLRSSAPSLVGQQYQQQNLLDPTIPISTSSSSPSSSSFSFASNGSLIESLDASNIDSNKFWKALRKSYQCYNERDREAYCCVGCTLGFVSAINKLMEWKGEKLIFKLVNLDLSEWCQNDALNGTDIGSDQMNVGYDVCCKETIESINASIRWCDIEPAPCSHQCHEGQPGSSKVRCSCWEGYRLHQDGRQCIDVDECQELTHDCNGNYEECSNTIGGYQCLQKNSSLPPRIPGLSITGNRHECAPGYYFNFTEYRCKDIDECRDEFRHNCKLNYEVCINRLGSFICERVGIQCPKGFRRMMPSTDFDTGCRDIDECQEGLYDCDYLREDCENTIGGFICEQKLNRSIRTTSMSRLYAPPIPESLVSLQNETLTSSAQQPSASSVSSVVPVVSQNGSISSCPKGYHFVRFTFQCEDINECLIGQHNCNLSIENCINFPGSFSCIPINKTMNNNNIVAKNPPSQPELGCPNGYERNQFLNICEDLDECRRSISPCPNNSLCQNTIGSYVCHCKSNFIKNPSGQCEDIDECAIDPGRCPKTTQCVNTYGSYECAPLPSSRSSFLPEPRSSQNSPTSPHCPQGKLYDPINKKCVNINDMQGDKRNLTSPTPVVQYPSKKCKYGERMTDGQCKPVSCGKGFFYNETDQRCQDSNECLEYSPCRSYEKCTNTIGSYRCTRRCDPGYRLSYNGQSCEDIDECATGNYACPPNKICKNRRGSYSCECAKGFMAHRDGSCRDIDECEQGDQYLCENSQTQTCVNTIGSYRCRCKDGYQEVWDGIKIDCLDIDECKNSSINHCEHFCHNFIGSFKCSCLSGYKLSSDGYNCIDEDECEMFQQINRNNLMNDFTEDINNNNNNNNNYNNNRGLSFSPFQLSGESIEYRSALCPYKCFNIPGSFQCVCPEGYESLKNGTICRDIDECERNENICHDNEYCLNLKGSYRCILITCPHGYYYVMKTKQCLRHLEGIMGYQDLSKPLSLQYNYLSIASDVFIPKKTEYIDLVEISGRVFTVPGAKYNLTLLRSIPGRYDVKPAMRENFILRRPRLDQIFVSLIEPLQGPQDVELELTLSLYPDDKFTGSTKYFLYIVVSEYWF